jgi:phosphatidylserine/phosphatidylglycerophosphate/cardiolipin synthase-like enzyme
MIVDDVWAIMGSSNFSRRGFFFDGSTDLVFCDRRLKNGKSLSVTNLRRNLMLQYIRSGKGTNDLPVSNKVLLQNGRSAFDMLKALVDGGGAAMIRKMETTDLSAIETGQLDALKNLADPDHKTFDQPMAVLSTWLSALDTVPE